MSHEGGMMCNEKTYLKRKIRFTAVVIYLARARAGEERTAPYLISNFVEECAPEECQFQCELSETN